MRHNIFLRYVLIFIGLLALSGLTLRGPLSHCHVFVKWPEGITTWAIILTLFAIAEQTEQTSRAMKVANSTLASQEATSKRSYVPM